MSRHVLTLLGYFEFPNGIAMKLYSGTLEKYVYDPKYEMDIQKILEIARDISMGIFHIHGYGIVHFDIKPSNILVEELENGKLLCAVGDFGVC